MATLDPTRNLVSVVVSTGYASGVTTVVLNSGEGARLPDPAVEGAFNLTWWNATDSNAPHLDSLAEIIRVTAITGNTLTITRAQESTSDNNHNVSGKTYRMELSITKKTQDDIITAVDSKLTNIVEDVTPQLGADLDLNHFALQFTPGDVAPSHSEGLLFYDDVNKTLGFYNDESASTLQIGQEVWLRANNGTGAQIDNGEVVYISGESGGLPTVMLARADLKATAVATIAIATHDVGIGAIGIYTRVGTVREVNTTAFTAGDRLYLSATTAGGIVNTEPTSPNYSVFLGNAGVIGATGTMEVELSVQGNTRDTIKFYNGGILEDHSIAVASDGATVTLSLEQSGGGDLSLFFNGEFTLFDSTPAATVSLTAGSDTSPTLNYVYIPESTNTLTTSTSSFPSTQHVPVATVLVQSATGVQTDGAYKVHAWTDHLSNGDDQGHLSHINRWIRGQNATWLSGVAQTITGGVNTFDVATSAGNILQLHEHVYPAFDTATGSDLFIVNDSVTAFKKVGDLTQEILDSTGASMSGKSYNIVVWGVVNEASADCKMMTNLPDGSYNTSSGAINDANKTSNYNIPSDFVGTGFLIARITVTNAGGAGGTFTINQTEDLRGQFPSTFAGGSAGTTTEFADNTFRIQDNGDVTKEIAFEASTITTGNTRTLTVQDQDGTIALLSDITAAGISRFDATVGATGADYTTITAAYADSKFTLLVTDNVTETSTLTLNGNDLYIYNPEEFTITYGVNEIIASAITNLTVEGLGTIDYTATTGTEWFNPTVTYNTSILRLNGITFDNNSTSASAKVANNCQQRYSNIRLECANVASGGIGFGTTANTESWIVNSVIVGGGSSSENCFQTSGGNVTVDNIVFTGTFKTGTDFNDPVVLIGGNVASNIVWDAASSSVFWVTGGSLNNFVVTGAGIPVLIAPEAGSIDNISRQTGAASGVILDMSLVDNCNISNCYLGDQLLDLTDVSASNNKFSNVKTTSAITVAGDSNKFSNCEFGTVTVSSGADNNQFIGCTATITDSGTNTVIVSDTETQLVAAPYLENVVEDTTPQLGGTLDCNSKAINEAKGGDIASATTTDIGAATGNYVDITGTTTITGFGTVNAGTRRKLQFDGILILTHNATSLILPTGANITTAAGDVATMVSLGSGNWKCTDYTRADGTSLVGASVAKSFVFVITESDTDTAVADGKSAFVVPVDLNGMNITAAVATVHTAGTTNTTDIQLRRRRATTDVDVFSTKLTIDSAETSSTTAAVAVVINAANDDLVTGDSFYADVDQVSTTAAKGLSVIITAETP